VLRSNLVLVRPFWRTAVSAVMCRDCATLWLWLSSKANRQRSRAASSAEFCKGGSGGRGICVVISPISTFSASLSLFLGELSGRAIRRLVDGRDGLAGVDVQRVPERRSRAAAARLLAAPNSGPYSLPNMNRTGLRCRPFGVGLCVEPVVTARSRNPTSSSVRIAPRIPLWNLGC
jgi:hypothetical protein